MTHELEVKVKATADTADLEKLKQDLSNAKQAAEEFRNALNKSVLDETSASMSTLSDKVKTITDSLSQDIVIGIKKAEWDGSVKEKDRTLEDVKAVVNKAMMQATGVPDEDRTLRRLIGEVTSIHWGKVTESAHILEDVEANISRIANKSTVIEEFSSDLTSALESKTFEIDTDVTLSTEIYKELDDLVLHPYSLHVAFEGLESIERARECLDSIEEDCRYLESMASNPLAITASLTYDEGLFTKWNDLKRVLDEVREYAKDESGENPYVINVDVRGNVPEKLVKTFETLATYKAGLSETLKIDMSAISNKEYQEALKQKEDFAALVGEINQEINLATVAMDEYVARVIDAHKRTEKLVKKDIGVKAAFGWDLSEGEQPPPMEDWPIAIHGMFDWDFEGSVDEPPRSPMDLTVIGYFEWADIEGNPPISIDLKGVVKGALEVEDNVVNVLALAHVVPTSMDEDPTGGFMEPEPRGGLREWVKNHFKFASGNVAMVAEGGEDEMVVHKNLLRGGPAVLDQYHAYMFGASSGGTVVTTRNGEDIGENYNIIPRSRYAEFRSRIFPGFAEGNATEEAIWGDMNSISRAVVNLEGLYDLMKNMAGLRLAPTQLGYLLDATNRLEERLSSIDADTSNISERSVSLLGNLLNEVDGMTSGMMARLRGDLGDGVENSKTWKQLEETQKTLESMKKTLNDLHVVVYNIDQKAGAEGSAEDTTVKKKKGFWARTSESLFGTDMFSYARSEPDVSDEENATRQKMREGRAAFANEFISKTASVGEDLHTKLLHKTFDLIQQIYGKMKEASPLLQTVETLFNLAMRLFFMPLGNKLAEILIPATVELVEKVTDMWDMFDENMTLGEMFSVAIKEGIEMLSEYFFSIGDTLRDQGGLVGRIGTLIVSIGNFLEKNGESTLNFLFGIMDSVIHFFPEIIGAIVGFKVASLAQSIVNTYALAAAISQTGTLGNLVSQGGLSMLAFLAAEAGMTAAVGLVSAAATTTAIQTAMPSRHAKGGYIPSSPTGTVVLAGEGGEGEYIIPESKLGAVLRGGSSLLSKVAGGATVDDVYYNDVGSGGGGSVTGVGAVFNATYYINGYTDSELKNIIRETVDDMAYNSRLKGRYW